MEIKEFIISVINKSKILLNTNFKKDLIKHLNNKNI